MSDNRINRNIVECKSVGMVIQTQIHRELIETLWNVNCFKLFLGVLSCLN